jgi:hypothetical protein
LGDALGDAAGDALRSQFEEIGNFSISECLNMISCHNICNYYDL